MFWYTIWMLVRLTQKVLSSATLSNEIFYGSPLIKNLILLFVCLPQQQNEFYSAATGTKNWWEATTMF